MPYCSPLPSLLLASFLLLGLTAAASTAAEPPTDAVELRIELAATSVAAAGLPAGGAVEWFAVWREPSPRATKVVRLDAHVIDEDGDGVAVLELEREVPPGSLWIAVEPAGGAFVAARPDRAVEARPLPAAALRAERGEVDLPGLAEVELLVVRPGARPADAGTGSSAGTYAGTGPPASVWPLTAYDGGPGDGDGTVDGRISAYLPAAALRSPEAPPPTDLAQLAPGDVVLAVDPRTLDLFAVRVTGGR